MKIVRCIAQCGLGWVGLFAFTVTAFTQTIPGAAKRQPAQAIQAGQLAALNGHTGGNPAGSATAATAPQTPSPLVAPTVSNLPASGTAGSGSSFYTHYLGGVSGPPRPTGSALTGRPVASRIIVKLRNGPAQSLASAGSAQAGPLDVAGVAAADQNLAALFAKQAVRSVLPLFPGMVRAKRQLGRSEDQLMSAIRQRFPSRTARAPAGRASPDLSSTYVLDLGERTDREVADALRSLQADPSVLYAEEDKVVQALYVPNDPSYSSANSWGQGYDDLYGLKKIGTTQAWDVTQGQGVVVAVVDTGIDYNHPDIANNIWINPGEVAGNGIDEDHNGYVDDVRGWNFIGHDYAHPAESNDPYDGYFHGTHVAGTIAATGNNNTGVIGVAWKAKVMAVKALDDNGYGIDSALARAIVYAVDNGADVINASWGGGGSSQTITDAIAYAYTHGVVFVAAAGNSTTDTKDFYPANAPDAIAVSSLDPYDNLSAFSNFGSKVELAAPGEDILSLQAGTTGYQRLSGTSMAAPHVSGTAALIIAQHPEYSLEQIRQALRISATDLGVTGKDSSFGYGRVNAAQAVLVSHVLEARISSPADEVVIAGVMGLTGTAGGPGFAHYVVDFGAGQAPVSWTTLRDSTTSVASGDVGTFDPSTLPDGLYTVRLRAFDSGGAVFSDQIELQVRYLAITTPLAPRLPSLTQEVKPGLALQISGTATGPSFQSYRIEWALGPAATTGWSTAGVVLAGNGLTPVTNGLLGTWTPPSNLQGECTIRLTVTNAGFSSTALTAIYSEPALVAAGWPTFVGPLEYTQGPQPVRQPDGSTRFLLSGFPDFGGTLCYSFGLDGSVITAPLDFGGERQACVGNLDGQPGDEIVIADGLALKILSSNLAPVRSIVTAQPRVFWVDQPILADLDNDGIPEIIAPARDTQSLTGTSYRQSGALYVYRADGTLFPGNYPLTITSPLTTDGSYDGYYGVAVVAVDLDGDGRKEIVMAVEASDSSGYTLQAINADGTPYAAWSVSSVRGFSFTSLSAADLDHDGTSEVVIGETSQDGLTNQVRVLNSTGMMRPGWPVVLDGYGSTIAIADLDHDQHHEIIAASPMTIYVMRADGTFRTPPQPLAGGSNYNLVTPPLVADIDGDGVPEIIMASRTVRYAAPNYYHYPWVATYRLDGSLLQTWPLFGLNDQQPFIGVPLVGDFSGDGRTDIVVQTSLVAGGGLNGFLQNSALTCLTTGTPFNAVRSDWTGNFRDSLNSRNANASVPLFTTQPSGQTVTAGRLVKFTAAASGSPIPTFQWRKNGTNIPGATRASLTIAAGQPGDAGTYTVVASNLFGSTTSNSAVLAVSGVAAANDFNADGTSDIIWQNKTTGDRGFWLMNGTAFASWVDLGYVSTDWHIAATADFNSDGKPDFFWENTVTGDRGFWLMNGTAFASWVDLGYVSTDWHIAATGDFNGDGSPDILWQNMVTGDRGFWLMNGTTFASWVDLGYVSTDWQIATTGDFNGDGSPDILWQNMVTGDRGFWLMNGTTFASWVDLGYVSTDWRIAGVGDFNNDGKTDILWENTATGDRGFWLMNGTTFAGWVDIGYVSTDWGIVN